MSQRTRARREARKWGEENIKRRAATTEEARQLLIDKRRSKNERRMRQRYEDKRTGYQGKEEQPSDGAASASSQHPAAAPAPQLSSAAAPSNAAGSDHGLSPLHFARVEIHRQLDILSRIPVRSGSAQLDLCSPREIHSVSHRHMSAAEKASRLQINALGLEPGPAVGSSEPASSAHAPQAGSATGSAAASNCPPAPLPTHTVKPFKVVRFLQDRLNIGGEDHISMSSTAPPSGAQPPITAKFRPPGMPPMFPLPNTMPTPVTVTATLLPSGASIVDATAAKEALERARARGSETLVSSASPARQLPPANAYLQESSPQDGPWTLDQVEKMLHERTSGSKPLPTSAAIAVAGSGNGIQPLPPHMWLEPKITNPHRGP